MIDTVNKCPSGSTPGQIKLKLPFPSKINADWTEKPHGYCLYV